jgi:hypothetical protein
MAVYTADMPLGNELPPESVLEILEKFGVEVHGWYAESAEGALTRYEDEPSGENSELAEELEEAASAAA